METKNNTDVGGPLIFAVIIVILIIGIIWALSQ
jgi:hypothetical protein